MIAAFFASLAGRIVIGLVGAGLLFTVGKCVVDGIGDAREDRLRKEAVEDRLEGIRDAKERERLERLRPLWAKARCAAEGRASECCGADLARLPGRCTAPVAGDE